MDSYQEQRFRSQVDSALAEVRKVLDVTRNPQYPADVPHQYDDKYGLVNFAARSALAGILQALETLGLDATKLRQLKDFSSSRAVTLRFSSEEKCAFERKATRTVESAVQHVTEISVAGRATASIRDKTVTTIHEWFWDFQAAYKLQAFAGTSESEGVVGLESRTGQYKIKTTTEVTPKPAHTVIPAKDLNITWLLQQLDSELRVNFTIDRLHKSCKTPRRNQQIEDALSFLNEFDSWASHVNAYIASHLFHTQRDHGLDLSIIRGDSVFVPVVPFFEKSDAKAEEKGAAAAGSDWPSRPVLSPADLATFLAEQKRSLAAKFADLARVFPAGDSLNDKLITVREAKITVVLQHITTISERFQEAVSMVEALLYSQLSAAIGKQVQPADFANYMRFHYRKLYREEFQPTPFCHAIRRPEHYPEGVVSIEAETQSSGDKENIPEPIFTLTRRVEPAAPMFFSLNAATRVSFLGERYLHAWVSHQFSGSSGLSLFLNARARQFSSFLLLVGRIVSANEFEPKAALIVQNKDDLKIPLMLEQLPTAKEFRDAIESLSPEQQRFAKAFRAMQLESSLFGLCVIQLKPQLEKLLNLPYDSLTKEIRLTEDLLELFIKYQIPSDMLSYAGDAAADGASKLEAVKRHVKAIQDMILQAKKQEMEEEMRKAMYAQPLPTAGPPQMAMAMCAPLMMAKSSARTRSAAPRMALSMAESFSAPVPTALAAPAPPPPPSAPAVVQLPVPELKVQPPQAAAATPAAAGSSSSSASTTGSTLDLTTVPAQLDRQLESLDADAALRPTIINMGDTWSKTSQAALLAKPSSSMLRKDSQKSEKDRAFDLLDALSRSGALSLDFASLHVLLASTHCFDKSVVDTVIQDNVNPIEKVERSSLIVASTIHGLPASQLIKPDQLERISTFSPMLIPAVEVAAPSSAAAALPASA